jgi:HEAT repeat protein
VIRGKLILASATIFLAIVSAESAPLDPATQKIYRQVDSLFVIASSGEVKYRDKVEPATNAIVKIGATAVPHLIDKLNTHSARERLTLIDILTKIGSPAVPKLVEALGRPQWLVVQRVCWALGDIKDAGAVEPLKQTAFHPNWQVREYSIRAIGKIGDVRGVQSIIRAFSDSVGAVRKAAASAAGEMKSTETIHSLVSALGDSFYGTRFAAMDALLSMDTVKVIDALKEDLLFASNLKANLICQTLGKIGTTEALNVLSTHLESDKMEQRTYAAVAIAGADPDDLCGFGERIQKKVIDRLALVQIESARKAAQSAREKSQ